MRKTGKGGVIMFYTGVGSRATPPDVLVLMTRIANKCYRLGYILRSGGAIGADQAFERGALDKKEIYLAAHSTPEAEAMAAMYHPKWNACNAYVRRLHGRNCFQVLGLTLDTPSSALVCWTPDGCESHAERTRGTGGTGTAISIANAYNVPIFNLQRESRFRQWQAWVGS
jgi:hypothetical protein